MAEKYSIVPVSWKFFIPSSVDGQVQPCGSPRYDVIVVFCVKSIPVCTCGAASFSLRLWISRIALGRATVLWKVPDPAFCLCILIPDPKYDAADPKQRLLEGSACPVCVTPPPTPSQRGLPQAAPKQPVVLSSSTPCKSHREISVAVCPEHV
ncbi:uncharacterized protein [Macaca nemestrina]|uniref:uncharacterized protein isoform X2 n=1 Tax=Macaca nemestrina TaxID=9545 RepID=UPI0039B8E039